MQFNPGTGQGFADEVWSLSKTNSTSFPIADIARKTNIKRRKYGLRAWKNSNQWRFEDSNQSTLPIATLDLVNGQEDYELPTTVFEVNQVYVLDAAGNWSKLTYFDRNLLSVPMDEWNSVSGIPQYYTMIGRSILLKPAPATSDITLTAGLKMHLERDVVDLTAASTTTEIGFGTNLDPLFIYEVAAEYPHLSKEDRERIQTELVQWVSLFDSYISGKGKQIKRRITVRHENCE